jgi:DNA-binding CsgD family transcriptional regulator
VDNLTDRCREVLKLAADGMTNREIAKELGLSALEVKACLDALFGRGGDDGTRVS